MVIQAGEFDGTEIIYVWLSKREEESTAISNIIGDLKKRYRVCIFQSGDVPATDYVRKLIMDNIEWRR